MDAVSSAAFADGGCPSGLAPPVEAPSSDARVVRPDPAAFVLRDAKTGRARLELLVRGAKCAKCIRKIETGLMAVPGVAEVRLNLSTGRLVVTWPDRSVDPAAVVAALDRLGYDSAPFDPGAAIKARDDEGRDLLRRLTVAGFGAMNAMMFSVPIWFEGQEMQAATRSGFYWLSAAIAVPCALYALSPFWRSAWRGLKAGQVNMDFPITLAVVLTLGVSLSETMLNGRHAYFDGAAMLLFLLLIGRYLDHSLREKAREAAKELLALQAVTATRLEPNGTAASVRAKDVRVGDRLLLAAGERAPADGVVEEGLSDIDRALVTGESAPAPIKAGEALQAGVVNLTRPLVMRATATADGSMVAELARLIEAGEQGRARYVRLADHATRLYVPIVHALALGTFLYWLVIAGVGAREAILNAAAVLIITCPCALGLAVPAVQVVATGRLFKRGVLVRSGDALERLAEIDRVLLDKTGTLTLGRPRLVSAPEAAIDPAAKLARASRHPLSRALVEAAGQGVAAIGAVETPGEGVEAMLDGRRARLGKATFVAKIAADRAMAMAPSPGLELWFAREGETAARFGFADALRADAAKTIAALTAQGLAPALISGDRAPAVAEAAAAAGGLPFEAELSPKDKIARLEAMKAEGLKPLMLGDGLNDAAALAAAHASASPGTAVDATQAAADVVIQGAGLAPILEAIDVAKKARRRVMENFALSALYNALAIPLAAAGFLTPFIAAIAMSGSSLAVTLNALRLAGGEKR